MQMNVASSWRRFFARCIDSVITAVIYLPLGLQIFGPLMRNEEFEISWRWLFLCYLFNLFFRLSFMVLLGGTVGKLICGLRIVNVNNGERISWIQGMVRLVADSLSLVFKNAFQVLMFVRLDRRHISDWLAETQVVQSSPRAEPPKRRALFTVVFFIYFLLTGLSSSYQLFKRMEWTQQGVTVYPQKVE